MIVLLDTAGIMVTAAAVLCVWQARRLWLYGEPKPLRTTYTATVVRPIQSPGPVPGRPAAGSVAPRIIKGEIQR